MNVTVHATLKNLKISDKKVRLVVDIVRGMPIAAARAQLLSMGKIAARPVLKLIESAVANAVHNFSADAPSLRVERIMVDKAPMLYRFMPRARGTAAPIRRHYCHIKVILAGTAPEKPSTTAPAQESTAANNA